VVGRLFFDDTECQIEPNILSKSFIEFLHFWSDDEEDVGEVRVSLIEEVDAFFVGAVLLT